jgi:hypothetical protein
VGRSVRWPAATPGAPQGVTLGQLAFRGAFANDVTTTWAVSAGLGWVSLTGDVLVRAVYLDADSDVYPITVSIGGRSVTEADSDDAGRGGETRGCGVFLGTARSLPIGSPLDVTIAASGEAGAGRIGVWLSDIAGWGGVVGCHTADVVTEGAAVTRVSTVATLAGSGGLLVGIAGVSDADSGPLTADGWTRTSTATIGTTAGSSLAAAVWSRTGGSVGQIVDLTVDASLAWSEFAVGFLELS